MQRQYNRSRSTGNIKHRKHKARGANNKKKGPLSNVPWPIRVTLMVLKLAIKALFLAAKLLAVGLKAILTRSKNPAKTWRLATTKEVAIYTITCVTLVACVLFSGTFIGKILDRAKVATVKINNAFKSKITTVELKGNVIIAKKDILKSIYKISPQGLPILRSEEEISQELAKNPIIKQVVVSVRLPDKLLIIIKERKVLMKYLNKETGHFLAIDEAFSLFSYSPTSDHLVKVYGAYNPEETKRLYKALSAFPQLMSKVDSASIFMKRNWHIVIGGKTLAIIPKQRIESAVETLNDMVVRLKILERPIKRVDFRANGKIIIRLFQKGERQVYTEPESAIIITHNMPTAKA